MVAISGYWLWVIALFLVGTVAGVAAIPVTAALLSKSLPMPARDFFGRLLWTVGSVINGKNVLDLTESREWEMRPVVKKDGDWQFKRNGEWEALTDGFANWGRLGRSKFGVTYEMSEQQFGSLLQPDTDGATDGGVSIVERGDEPGLEKPGQPDDGYRVRIGKLISRLEGAAGIELANRGEDTALQEHGNGKEASPKMLMVASVMAVLLGTVSGVLVTMV